MHHPRHRGIAGGKRARRENFDFEDKKKLEKFERAIQKNARIDIKTKIAYDEEHSLYEMNLDGGTKERPVTSKIPAGRLHPRRNISACWALYRLVEPVDHPPFQVARNGDKVSKERTADVLAYVLADARKNSPSRDSKVWAKLNPDSSGATTMNVARKPHASTE